MKFAAKMSTRNLDIHKNIKKHGMQVDDLYLRYKSDFNALA